MKKRLIYDILFVLLVISVVFVGLSLFSHSNADPSYSNIVFSRYDDTVENIFGKMGAYTSDMLGTIFGWCALFIPFGLTLLLVQCVKLYRKKISGWVMIVSVFTMTGFILMFSVLSGIIGGGDPYFTDKPNGGIFGVVGGTVVSSVIGRTGGIILCVFMLGVLGLILTRVSLIELVRQFIAKLEERKNIREEQGLPKHDFFYVIKGAILERRRKMLEAFEERLKEEEEKEEEILSTPAPSLPSVEPATKSTPPTISLIKEEPTGTPPPLIVPQFKVKVAAEEPKTLDKIILPPTDGEEQCETPDEAILPSTNGGEFYETLDEAILKEELLTVAKLEELLARQEEAMLNMVIEESEDEDDIEIELETADEQSIEIIPAHVGDEQSITPPKRMPIINYHVDISLLDTPAGGVIEQDHRELEEKADLLTKKLQDFKVDGIVERILPGPVVTLFEFKPAAGVTINKIANLENDLALAMSALSIRIIAPIPGKSVVGIEIPNAVRSMVSIRELLEVEEFSRYDSPLTVALGKDISGKPYFSDLRKMPHLLVAGTTGSGKSVCINTIICSIIYKSPPDLIKFVMIDPKMVELSVYEGIPHLAAPVVTDPRKAAAVLANVVKEMEARYTLLAANKVRNIDSYNNAHRDNPMPYMVVIVDEFGDLMMVAGKDVENAIIRIAQMARAVGIHLILATQRPSVNVITGIIKANMPARISFRVSSKIDSRTILDQNGAELLLGRGDSLFVPPGSSDAIRIHGSFVGEHEVLRIVDALKVYGEPQYDMALLAEERSGDDFDDEELDPRYDEALKIVREKGFASISMIQRYLRIGYNRAARIVESMEHQGLIAQSDGTSKPRELLKRD